MEILTKQSDDPEFVELVKHVIAGCVHDGFPRTIIVIKIDNWFDHKWLGFSGKGRVGFGFHGDYLVDMDTALDEFRQDQITLPPSKTQTSTLMRERLPYLTLSKWNQF